jgi:ATP-dependent HslUV protease subunit HslV
MSPERTRIRSTTVLLVRRDAQVALAGDGQVTLGDCHESQRSKVRRLNDRILAGFARNRRCFRLLTRFEQAGNITANPERAAIELSGNGALTDTASP